MNPIQVNPAKSQSTFIYNISGLRDGSIIDFSYCSHACDIRCLIVFTASKLQDIQQMAFCQNQLLFIQHWLFSVDLCDQKQTVKRSRRSKLCSLTSNLCQSSAQHFWTRLQCSTNCKKHWMEKVHVNVINTFHNYR